MKFEKSVIEVINERKSCRSFGTKKIDKGTLLKLNDYINEINAETKIKARFLLADKQEKSDDAVKIGTYGMISGANSFIIGISDKDEKNALKFGYLFEKILLFATDLGLGTCWLGGTFNRSGFEQNTSLLENEFIPIISPIGYKKDKPRFLDTAVRTVIGADNRKPWSELFFDGNISAELKEDSAGAYKIPLEMVRLAPSASNKQPWRVIKDKSGYHFYLCRTKGYGLAIFDMQKNDLGIAMCHFELTAYELGLNGGWVDMKKVDVPDEWEYIVSWADGISKYAF